MWEDIKNSKRHPIHKATFPIELPQTILKCFKDAKVILDPYMGIGTTACAVIQENKLDDGDRLFIVFDVSKDYCDIAKERIENAHKNL